MATPRPFVQIPDGTPPERLPEFLRVLQNNFAAAIADIEGRLRVESPATQKRLHATAGTRVTNALYAMEGPVTLDKARMGQDGDVLYLIDGGKSAVWGNGTTPAPTGGGTGPSVGKPHPLLDGDQDNDTVAHTVSRGDMIVGNSTPKWDALAKGSAHQFLRMNAGGTDPTWETVAYQNVLLDGVNHTDTAAATPVKGDLISHDGAIWNTLSMPASGDKFLARAAAGPTYVETVAQTGTAKVDLTGQTSGIGATNLRASGHTAGVYQVSVVAICTTASGSGAPTLDVTIGWTDTLGATTKNAVAGLSLSGTGRNDGVVTIRSTGAAAITYATTINAASGTPQYALYVRTLFLG